MNNNGFYCDIFTNIHVTFVFIVVIILIIVIVQYGGSSFLRYFFLNGLKSGLGCSKSQLTLTQDLKLKESKHYFCI